VASEKGVTLEHLEAQKQTGSDRREKERKDRFKRIQPRIATKFDRGKGTKVDIISRKSKEEGGIIYT